MLEAMHDRAGRVAFYLALAAMPFVILAAAEKPGFEFGFVAVAVVWVALVGALGYAFILPHTPRDEYDGRRWRAMIGLAIVIVVSCLFFLVWDTTVFAMAVFGISALTVWLAITILVLSACGLVGPAWFLVERADAWGWGWPGKSAMATLGLLTWPGLTAYWLVVTERVFGPFATDDQVRAGSVLAILLVVAMFGVFYLGLWALGFGKKRYRPNYRRA